MAQTEINKIRIEEILERIEKNNSGTEHFENFQFENQDTTEENRMFIVHYFEQIKDK